MIIFQSATYVYNYNYIQILMNVKLTMEIVSKDALIPKEITSAHVGMASFCLMELIVEVRL